MEYKRNSKINEFYRINIFEILLKNLKNNYILSEKIKIALKIINQLEEIIDNDYLNSDEEFTRTLKLNLKGINERQITDNEDLISFINAITVINQTESFTGKQKIIKIFRNIEEWINIQGHFFEASEIMNRDEQLNQVFLSYAYNDKVFTAGLFYYFLKRGIYLYIDWMHNGKINDGKKLKIILKKELDKSKQLLFLDSLSSQFNIAGGWQIRQWCAWEFGCFYREKSRNRKFYISIYKGTNAKKRLKDNLFLHTFSELHHIRFGRLK